MSDYTWENLNSREFEIIACNYANGIFSEYSWSLTQPIKDDNHDFEAIYDDFDKWGEAKHSNNPRKTMSRAQWDPTIVSAKLINSVNEVLLVTCADIPLTYIIRSFHMIENSLEKVFYANRLLLNEWYDSNPKLADLDLDYPIKSIKDKINRKKSEFKIKSNLKIFCFNQIERNFLTSIKEVHNKSIYEIDIAMFISENYATISIPTNPSVRYITDIHIYNVSFPDRFIKTVPQVKSCLNLKISQGYNIIKLNVVINQKDKEKNQIYYKVFLNGKKYLKTLTVFNTIQAKNENIIGFEKEINGLKSTKNSIIHIKYLPLEKFNRFNKKYFFIRFDEREKYNYSKLCQMILHLITGIDFATIDEKVLRNVIIKYDHYLLLEDFIVGTFDSLLAYECLSNSEKANSIFRILKCQQKSHDYFYIIENTSALNERGYDILKCIEANFVLHNNKNLIIYQDYNSNSQPVPTLNDRAAIVLFFENGVLYRYINKGKVDQNNKFICKDIDGLMAYPNYSNEISLIIEYLRNKNLKELKQFFNQIYDIISFQSWSNRVLDAITLLKNKINPNLYIDVLRKIRDLYYAKTDFWNAYGYSKVINQINNQSPINIYIDDVYKEADELNHCGSITKSREKFYLVVNLIEKYQLHSYKSKKLEALTEIYNISFWLLDTKELIKKINDTILKYYPHGVSSNLLKRDQYPYYNCLNRRMVTEYLLELYEDAEKSFSLCLKESKLKNYTAFAYMDSARGLYKQDIQTAYRRLKKAYEILCHLKESNQEIRRFYDCSVEIAYVEFVLANDLDRQQLINCLQDKVYDIKKRGLNSMVKKCYFKLAACYLVLGNLKKAKVYLDIIHNDKDFSSSPRNQMMYNNLQVGYFYLLTNKSTFYSNKSFKFINFNCFENNKEAELYIETRLW